LQQPAIVLLFKNSFGQRQQIRRDLGALNAEEHHAPAAAARKRRRVFQSCASVGREISWEENVSEWVHDEISECGFRIADLRKTLKPQLETANCFRQSLTRKKFRGNSSHSSRVAISGFLCAAFVFLCVFVVNFIKQSLSQRHRGPQRERTEIRYVNRMVARFLFFLDFPSRSVPNSARIPSARATAGSNQIQFGGDYFA